MKFRRVQWARLEKLGRCGKAFSPDFIFISVAFGRSRVRFPLTSLEFFYVHNPSGRTVALGADPVSNTNVYEEYFLWGKGGRCVGLTTLPPSCADCLEIWYPQPPGTLWPAGSLYRDCFTCFPLTCCIRYLGIAVTCKLMLRVAAILVVGTKMNCRQYPFCVRRSDGTEHRVIITAMYSGGLRLKPQLSWLFSPLVMCSNSN